MNLMHDRMIYEYCENIARFHPFYILMTLLVFAIVIIKFYSFKRMSMNKICIYLFRIYIFLLLFCSTYSLYDELATFSDNEIRVDFPTVIITKIIYEFYFYNIWFVTAFGLLLLNSCCNLFFTIKGTKAQKTEASGS